MPAFWIRGLSLRIFNVKISSSLLHPWTPLLPIGIVRFDLVWKKNVQMFLRSFVRAKMLAFLYKRDYSNNCLMDQMKVPLCCCLYWKVAGRDGQYKCRSTLTLLGFLFHHNAISMVRAVMNTGKRKWEKWSFTSWTWFWANCLSSEMVLAICCVNHWAWQVCRYKHGRLGEGQTDRWRQNWLRQAGKQ